MAVAGDVFAVRLPGGRFGAIRIIKLMHGYVSSKATYHLVYCSTYLDSKPPTIDDPRLREPVRRHRFSFKGQPAMKWIPGKPPSEFKLIGNIPPRAVERKKQCSTFGLWHWSVGDEALREWRWIHERKKVEDEARKRDEEEERLQRKRLLSQKPKYMMREARFWSLIDALDWRHTGKDEKVIEPVVRSLAKASVREIKGFEERLAYNLFRLDTKDHARRLTRRASEDPSADGFLYARCGCVANGKRFYDEVRKEPKRFPKDVEFESLLRIAGDAYERKTGDDFDYDTGCSYESFSNVRAWAPRKRKSARQ